MTFSEKLNEYMNLLGCSQKELSVSSGLSAATISRYRSGSRIPVMKSEHTQAIISGLAEISKQKHLGINAREIRDGLMDTLTEKDLAAEGRSFSAKFNMLTRRMHINIRELSQYLGVDYSYISRIRAGSRHPSKIKDFSEAVGRYVSGMLNDDISKDMLADVLGISIQEIGDPKNVQEFISDWLRSVEDTPERIANDFISELDRFDFDSFINKLDIDSITGEDRLNKSEKGGLIETEIKFLRMIPEGEGAATVITDLTGKDISEAGKDISLSVNDMISVLLRKGLDVNLVLRTDNPMDEIFIAIQRLLPVLMSGRIRIYYLKDRRDRVFINRLISLKGIALSEEGIQNLPECVRAKIYFEKEDTDYYEMRAKAVLEKAAPFINVVDSSFGSRAEFLADDAILPGNRISILTTPPIYIINDALLKKILGRKKVSDEDYKRISEYIKSERARVLKILKHSKLHDFVPYIDEDRFESKPIFLSLSGIFYDQEILYTYDEYKEHIRLIKEFEKKHPNYTCTFEEGNSFRNIQIFMHAGKWVMLSKNKTPAIHLMIDHPKLRQTIEESLTIYSGR